MNTDKIRRKRVVGSLGVLDIRRASDESVPTIDVIGSLGTVLYSRETAHLLSRINSVIGNLGNTVEASADARLVSGQAEFNRDYFKGRESPENLVVVGRAVVSPDLPAEDIENGLGELIVTGDLICPEHLAGLVQSRIRHLGGKRIVYPGGGRVVLGHLAVDKAFLQSLRDGSSLVVVGNLHVPQVLPNDLLERKIQNILVTGSMLVHEENAPTILERVGDRPSSMRTTTIPAGHELIDRSISLNGDSLQSLPSRKLYCTKRVQVDQNVDPAALDNQIESLICTATVLCPAALRQVIYRKCGPETRLALYEGELWTVDGVTQLPASRFDYLEGKATLFVSGVLTISPDVEPDVLADRLAFVHNTGIINCTPRQMGAIGARQGVSTGILEDSTKAQEDDDEGEYADGIIGNVAYLAF